MTITNKNKLIDKILDLTCEIQQIPSPTFHEETRAAFLLDWFSKNGLERAQIDPTGNVLACLPGMEGAPTVIVSAHLDTVFPTGTSLDCHRTDDRIQGPGIGDNSLGLAGLCGLVLALREQDIHLPGDMWLVATVCEEGLGDLRGIRGLFDRIKTGESPIHDPAATVILEGLGLGEVYNQGLEVRRYRVSCETPGGHSWIDYGKPSAVHELAALITQIMQIHVPRHPRTTLNVGVFKGGTTVNTIANHAEFELDLRSESAAEINRLIKQIETLVRTSGQSQTRFSMDKIGSRPAGGIPTDHPLVRLACDELRSVGINPILGMGSTDANLPLSLGMPAICIGLTQGNGAHTPEEYMLTQPLKTGMDLLVNLVQKIYTIDIN